MKKFFLTLLSDSNKVSSKRFIGLLCLIMLIVYGVFGIIYKMPVEFWIFYVSLNSITMWAAFRFISLEKALKYNVVQQLSQLGKTSKTSLSGSVDNFIASEKQLDNVIQPDEKLEG